MADRAKSNSKRKRSRNKGIKLQPKIEKPDETSTQNTVKLKEAYKVSFPEVVNSKKKCKVKSKSLDDDDTDSIRIEEITEPVEENQKECEGIVSEVESVTNTTMELAIPQTQAVTLSTVSIIIEEEPLQRVQRFSPQEELNLRKFLQDINLCNSPEASLISNTLDASKIEKENKRLALVSYFSPLVQNPRYLDIISEEGSDLSDRELSSKASSSKEKKENFIRSPKIARKNKLHPTDIENKTFLVCTKVLDCPSAIKHFHTGTEEIIEVEKVFLENSSSSSSSKSVSDSEEVTVSEENGSVELLSEDSDNQNITDNSEDNTKIETTSQNNCTDENTEQVQKFKSPTELLLESNELSEGPSEDIKIEVCTESVDQTAIVETTLSKKIYFDEMTPPPTPQTSPKNKLTTDNSIELSDSIEGIETDAAKTITSVLDKLTHYNPIYCRSQDLTCLSKVSFLSRSSRSPSQSSSSSRETSPSTVRLNPLTSSIADVTSILPDLELAKEALLFKQPLSLRQICLRFLFELPCGSDILQELSDISLNIDKLTHLSMHPSEKSSCSLESNNIDSFSATDLLMKNMSSGRWAGLAFPSNPNMLLFVSPTQKAHLDKSEVITNEPEVLTDLHCKFFQRESEKQSNHSLRNPAIPPEETDSMEDNAKSLSNARLRASNLSEWLKLVNSNKYPTNRNFVSRNAIIRPKTITKDQEKIDRRISLPDDIYMRQMQYILDKEKEIEFELEKLLEEKRKLFVEMEETKFSEETIPSASINKTPRPKSFPSAPSESFRQRMYEEYMKELTEREKRKHEKVIKVTLTTDNKNEENATPKLQATHVRDIEDEFMKKVHELHRPLDNVEEDTATDENSVQDELSSESELVLLKDGNSLKKALGLPKHLMEFVEITSTTSEESFHQSIDGVWSPCQKQEITSRDNEKPQYRETPDESIPPVWQPKSATSSPVVERKEFRPVNFESPKLGRKNKSEEFLSNSEKTPSKPSWQIPNSNSDIGIPTSEKLEIHIPKSESTPISGFNDYGVPRLPRAQNPTITLLQKARDGQLSQKPNYLEPNRDHYRIPQDSGNQKEIITPAKIDRYSESDNEISRRVVDPSRRKIVGVGPITRDGMPLSLRSEVRDSNQSKWYKKMYDTIHRQKPYKAQYPYITGYLSEPEAGAYDSDHMEYNKYATVDHRRTPMSQKENNVSTLPRSAPIKTASAYDIVHYPSGTEMNPGRIENYIPGHSSISDQESKRNVNGEKQPTTKGYLSQALKESGYESDSTLVFRRKENGSQLSPSEQKEAYKIIQKGGDIPLHGLRKAAPEKQKEPEAPLSLPNQQPELQIPIIQECKPVSVVVESNAPPPLPKQEYNIKEEHQEPEAPVPVPKRQHELKEPQQGSPRKYVENQVTIHYKTPVRQEIKEYYSEDELAHRKQEAMKKIYQEERRRKYLQELQDMHNRRHTDNFIPSLKSPIPLNRYDDFDDLVTPRHQIRPRSPESRLIARALYNFVGMTPRELTFRKGDKICVRRQIDKNWYEGELNAMVGLFPVNYVEIVPYEHVRTTPRKPHEGQARAKYNFLAKTHLELSFAKGEMVIITRRVDNNWYEGKIGGRKGIFPASYVDVLIDPQDIDKTNYKPVAAPASHSLLNGPSGRESMGSHTYAPNISNPNPCTTVNPAQPGYCYNYGSRSAVGQKNSLNQALHIDTQSAEPSPYKALYKYLPQNDDELELIEGDRVYVLEKCDDGWYVGSNERTGAFGTFPGNYVDKYI